MPRDGSLTPADLVGKLTVLRVECEKCGRSGRYRVERLVQQAITIPSISRGVG